MSQLEPPLRGYGSQSYSQDNGDFSEKSTTYSSKNIGQVQGDGIRHFWFQGGAFQFYGHAEKLGNFLKSGGVDLNAWWGETDYSAEVPLYRYRLVGDPESGYSLEETYMTVGVQTAWLRGGSGTRVIRLDSAYALPTANEIRPVNTAVRYFIRAR